MYRNKATLFIFILFFFSPNRGTKAQSLVADAGINQSVCRPGDSVTLGGFPTALGGTSPYTYSWLPTTGINNPALPNPHALINIPVNKFVLTVIDAVGNKAKDSTVILVDSVNYISAGPNQTVCGGTPVTMGSQSNSKSLIYLWEPSSSLTCSLCIHPQATPTVETTYTLIATDPYFTCNDTTTVTISLLGANLNTITPVSLDRGHSIFLQASGADRYKWYPVSNMFNPESSTPEVEPTGTFTYYVEGIYNSGCDAFDSVVVNVNDDSALVFYNTFTPNGDGINDTWYVGNIWQYKDNDLYVYNRYGKQVYYAHGYSNQWDGNSDSDELPAATYYYVLLTGTGKTYRGAVTIIRVR